MSQALDQKVYVTEDGRQRRVTKQLVNKSASADLRAIKQLTEIVERVDQQAGALPAIPPAPAFNASDEEVIAELKKEMERAIRAEIAAEKAEAAKKHPEGLLDEI